MLFIIDFELYISGSHIKEFFRIILQLTLKMDIKKRGRKPKLVSQENNGLMSLDIKITPTNTNNPISDTILTQTDDMPKRRGRKPKDQLSFGINNNRINDTESENIIIHLPIKSSQVLNRDNINTSLLDSSNESIKEPLAYETSIAGNPADSLQYISQKHNPNIGDLTGEGQEPIATFCNYPFNEKNKTTFDVIDGEIYNNNVEEDTNGIEINNVMDRQFIHKDRWFLDTQQQQITENTDNNTYSINKIISTLKQQRDAELENYSFKQNHSTVERCLIQMDECNKTQSWPSTTNICCWWDCHTFNGPPCALPIEIRNDVVMVKGIFCSPECAASYNFEEKTVDMWERYSLLNHLYRKIYQDKQIRIKLAPPRLCLKMFGGNLTIKEFRANNHNYNINYNIVLPPMCSIIPSQELSTPDNGYTSKTNKKYYVIEKSNILDPFKIPKDDDASLAFDEDDDIPF